LLAANPKAYLEFFMSAKKKDNNISPNPLIFYLLAISHIITGGPSHFCQGVGLAPPI